MASQLAAVELSPFVSICHTKSISEFFQCCYVRSRNFVYVKIVARKNRRHRWAAINRQFRLWGRAELTVLSRWRSVSFFLRGKIHIRMHRHLRARLFCVTLDGEAPKGEERSPRDFRIRTPRWLQTIRPRNWTKRNRSHIQHLQYTRWGSLLYQNDIFKSSTLSFWNILSSSS